MRSCFPRNEELPYIKTKFDISFEFSLNKVESIKWTWGGFKYLHIVLPSCLHFIILYLNLSRTRVFLSSPRCLVSLTPKPIISDSNDKFKSLKFIYFTNDEFTYKVFGIFKLILYKVKWSKSVKKMNALKFNYKPFNFDRLTLY